MCNMELSFQRWYRAGSDSGDIWFHMSHAEYSECISRASQSLLAFIKIAEKEFDIHMENVVKHITKPKLNEKKDESPNDGSNTKGCNSE